VSHTRITGADVSAVRRASKLRCSAGPHENQALGLHAAAEGRERRRGGNARKVEHELAVVVGQPNESAKVGAGGRL
jgi:hypothetical protein